MNSNIKECLQMTIDHFEKDIEAEKSNNCDTKNEKIYTKEDFMFTTENEYSKICEALESNSHFPTIYSYTLLRRKYQIELEAGNYKSAGMTLLHSQGITFQHLAMKQYSNRIWKANEKSKSNKNVKNTEGGVKSEEEDLFEDASSEEENVTLWSKKGESHEQMLNRLLSFQTSSETPEKCMNYLKKLPKEWRIVQISADLPSHEANPFKFSAKDEANRDENLSLAIVAIDCGEKGDDGNIAVHKVPAIHKGENPSILKEFQDILAMHKRIYSVDENYSKKQHNENRDEVDTRLTNIIDTMENKWLGFAKCLLFGRPVNEKIIEQVELAVSTINSRFFQDDETFVSSGRKFLLSRCLEAIHNIRSTQLHKCLLYCLQGQDDKFDELVEEVKNLFPSNDDDMFSKKCLEMRHPVILILDREIQCLPWESLMCFQDAENPQPMTRVPSLTFLFALVAAQETNAKSVSKTGVSDENIFYVLNPDRNLQKTQKRLEGVFQDILLGNGVTGEQPSLPQMQKVLSEMDAFVYCGHGGSLKSLPLQEIEKMNIRAVPLLFGCNSGKLSKAARHLDPLGTASSYLIATAPCLLGFLWSVTDRDLDNWTVNFLSYWLGKGESTHEENFARAVANQRKKFVRVINSAATVIYGLPNVKC